MTGPGWTAWSGTCAGLPPLSEAASTWSVHSIRALRNGVLQAAQAAGIDPGFCWLLASRKSASPRRLTSAAGGRGLAQLMRPPPPS